MLRFPIDSCDRDNAIHEIAVHLIADDAKSVIGGGIRLCENGGSREEHYGGKNSYHVRNGISLFLCVHRGLRVFLWKSEHCEATAADYPGSARVSRVGDEVSSSRISRKRLFRRDAESPSRTGVTRETRALRNSVATRSAKARSSRRGTHLSAIKHLKQC